MVQRSALKEERAVEYMQHRATTKTLFDRIFGAGAWRAQQRIPRILLYAADGPLALFFLFPTVFMIVSSLKTDQLQLISDMSGLRGFVPYGEIGLGNYLHVFTEMAFGRFFFNSVFILVTTIGGGLFLNSMFAFALARLHFPGRAAARQRRDRAHHHSHRVGRHSQCCSW